jgi:uncharacterized membrane protein YdjX (TVP38/TMEM64 family)
MLLLPSFDHLPSSVAAHRDIGVRVLFSEDCDIHTSMLIAKNNGIDFTQQIELPPTISIFDNIFSTLEISSDHTTLSTIVASYVLVTCGDMIPFVPCQPLAVALGAKLGWLAFPITSFGQLTAGILSFTSARQLSKSVLADEEAITSSKLSPEAIQKLEDFRKLTTQEEQGDMKILYALIGLRLAPFFPFSAGNYLLGASTDVPLRLFFLATLFGCLLSNFISVSAGAGGAYFLSVH